MNANRLTVSGPDWYEQVQVEIWQRNREVSEKKSLEDCF